WVRIGVAFDNKDGSLNVLLDALPLNGRLHIRSRPSDTVAEAADPPTPNPPSAGITRLAKV
ncbi:MAG: hypothetical protein ACREQQ_12560, partial [Candidatus Binatia bacterium]